MSKSDKKIIPLEESESIINSKNNNKYLLSSQFKLEDIIQKSDLSDLDSEIRTQRIIQKFNTKVKHSCFVVNPSRGTQINPGFFLLGVTNTVPELKGPTSEPIARRLIATMGKYTKIIGTYKQTEIFFGFEGSYVLNIPVGKYAVAYSLNKPMIFDQGTHVIHDQTFKFDSETGIIDSNQPYIRHGTIHIIRIPADSIAKIWLGQVPYILEHNPKPYIFNDPLFSFDSKSGWENPTESYINHGTIHILRIPSGKLATVWIGSDAKLLKSRDEPYIFNDPLFRIEFKSNKKYYFYATEKLIKHGNIKRIIPYTGEIAITYNNGNLEIYESKKNGEPIIINSPTHQFSGFLNTGIENLIFPSEEIKQQRTLENKKATPEELAYEIMSTRDSLKIGVKLFVAYKIIDPKLALTMLIDKKGIVKHIENIAVVDMSKAIQKTSSQEFLSSYQTQPKKGEIQTLKANIDPFLNNPPIMHYQDDVKQELAKDLREYGIELIRLNIETPKIIDQDIEKSMGNQSVMSSKINAEESIMEQKFRIAQKQAEQDANVKKIAIQQENESIITKAQADYNARKLNADAKLLEAETERKISEMRGRIYTDHPDLFKLEMEKIRMDALKKTNLNYINPPYGMNPLMNFLTPDNNQVKK